MTILFTYDSTTVSKSERGDRKQSVPKVVVVLGSYDNDLNTLQDAFEGFFQRIGTCGGAKCLHMEEGFILICSTFSPLLI